MELLEQNPTLKEQIKQLDLTTLQWETPKEGEPSMWACFQFVIDQHSVRLYNDGQTS